MVVSTLESLARTRRDPLDLHIDLPLSGTYFPLGFPLHLSANSRHVIDAAAESWGDRELEFPAAAPLVMRVFVHAEGELSQPGSHRMHGHLYSVISDTHNFAQVDLRSQFAVIHVSEKTAADHSWLRWFFVESLAYLMLVQRHIVMTHAGCVARDGAAVMLCGASGSGKSTLSYACARAGWTFLADDCTCLLPDSPERIAIARSDQARFRLDAPQLFPELERFTARARPTGKIGIEVPMSELPGIHTGRRASIAGVVFLERRPGSPQVRRISGEEAVELLLADMPSYGEEVDARHERTIRRLAEVPAFRAYYEWIDDGVRLVSDL